MRATVGRPTGPSPSAPWDWALTGLIELAIALVSGSVALLGDALHNLSDVSTSALVFVGFRASRRLPTERYPYGYERAEDLPESVWRW
jgi:divalent metal cation (Fe/Co/Zn/Cd) transporter